jgi:hypothetical protein
MARAGSCVNPPGRRFPLWHTGGCTWGNKIARDSFLPHSRDSRLLSARCTRDAGGGGSTVEGAGNTVTKTSNKAGGRRRTTPAKNRRASAGVKAAKPEWAQGLRQLYDSVVDEPLPDAFKSLLDKLDKK